jgi:NAD(P)-dependent dehydrogenase (short-subunit alcohol dehydrogenase family)
LRDSPFSRFIKQLSGPFYAYKMPNRLDGKVAIVTGGGSGFGKAISAKYVHEGAKVLIAEMNDEAGQAVAKELGCAAIQANVTSREDWKKVLEKSIELYGGPDIVVNNAGTCYSNQVRLLAAI